jgi:hypothetical protein
MTMEMRGVAQYFVANVGYLLRIHEMYYARKYAYI